MSEDCDWLHELFEPIGPITIRHMFGGAGLYRDGVMFGLVSGTDVYLKSDEHTAGRFREASCNPFVYEKNGKQVEMSYWSLPEEAFDDGEILKRWADLAYQAACKAKKPARGSSRKS